MTVSGADRFPLVETLLKRYRDVASAALQAYLPSREPRRYLYDLVPEYPLRAGKGLRPALCIATCRAFGGDLPEAIRSAVAIELFHNAFLVHDDVEDESEQRRGAPTLVARYGPAIAVNVGDAMNVLSIGPLMDNLPVLGPLLSWRVFAEVEHMVRESVEGQALELGWVRENRCDLEEADYLRMILKKTCWYTCIHPCRIGALIGSRGKADPDVMNRFGHYLGAAFQIQDDILNLVGDMERYGKEIGGDILEGKRTLMLVHALNTATAAERKRLSAFLATPRRQRLASDVRWVYRLMGKRGSIEYARSAARHLAGAALREFAVAYRGLAESEDRDLVHELILYMIERDL